MLLFAPSPSPTPPHPHSRRAQGWSTEASANNVRKGNHFWYSILRHRAFCRSAADFRLQKGTSRPRSRRVASSSLSPRARFGGLGKPNTRVNTYRTKHEENNQAYEALANPPAWQIRPSAVRSASVTPPSSPSIKGDQRGGLHTRALRR